MVSEPVPPTDDEIIRALREIMAKADLDNLTCGQVMDCT